VASASIGVARSAVGRGLVVVVDATLHLVIVAEGSVGSVGATEQLLAARAGVLVLTGAGAVGRAAADGEEPEKAGADGERTAEPDGSQVLASNVTADTVILGRALDSTDNNGGLGGGKTGSDTGQSGGDTSDKPGHAGDDARKVGEDAEDEFDDEGDQGDDGGNLRPPRDGAESLESILNLVGNVDLDASGRTKVLNVGGVERVSGPVELGVGAVAVLLFEVGPAKAPKVHIVRPGQAQVLGGDVDRLGVVTTVNVEELVDHRVYVGLVEGEVRGVEGEQGEPVMGDAAEGRDEHRHDGCEREDDGKPHAEETTDTDSHCGWFVGGKIEVDG
jgi:hypothetical protein